MLNILKKSGEFTKQELYKLTMSSGIVSVKDIPADTCIKPDKWVLFEKVDEESGDVSTILTMYDSDDDTTYATQSTTFQRNFFDICDLMEDDPFSVIKKSGKTKANRDFVYCELACD